MNAPADDAEPVDRVLAERLARGEESTHGRTELPLTDLERDDLMRRLNALDFVDSLVGGTSMPERIGDYRVTSLLGRGGMGTVYGAFQESLEREVALKVLSPALSADPTMRRRFRVEARATAALHHQHIVPIYDFGEIAGLLYFAMEKIDGVSLDRHIARARHARAVLYEPREAARRFAGVADALAHAHRRRILHRDVKPANLLVHRDGTLALADFGLSRVLGEASVRSSGRGGFLGTLQYASPEQARSSVLTPASDLYSLGVTIFEAVTGELPFRAETPEAVLDALLNQEPRSLRSVRPGFPQDLAAVVEKLLHKVPTDRYPDGETLARDLRRVADGEPVHVRRQPLAVRMWRRVRRRPGLSAALAAAGLLSVVSTYAITSRAIDMRSNRLASYGSLVRDAFQALVDDPGPPTGPRDVLVVLTGTPHEVQRSESVYAALERAHRFAPEQRDTTALRAAYEAEGHVEAEVHLRAGGALRAKQLLDERIKASVRELPTSPSSDHALVRLYPLVMARAVACLCASVADPAQARADLLMASLCRPGAWAPRLLLTIAELASTRDVETALQDLEALARAGPPGGARAVLEVVQAAAGDLRPEHAHLMRMPLTRGQRGRLLSSIRERLGIDTSSPGVRWSGLEADLARAAVEAMQPDSDRESQALRAARRRLADEVDGRSPLQSWTYVFELLQHGRSADRRVVPADRRPHACLDLLALDPPRALVAGLLDVFEGAADDAAAAGEPAVAAELRARLALQLDPSRAASLVDAWVGHGPDDPEAYMARLRACIASDLVVPARDAATIAMQRALHPEQQLRSIADLLRAAVHASPPALSAAWSSVLPGFERMP